jgi:hypothetical protein
MRWVGLVLGIGVAAASVPARAAEPGAVGTRKLAEAIQVQEGSCLTSAALLPLVSSWLGRDEIDARIEGVVRSDQGDVVFTLRREGVVVGERRFPRRAASCAEWMAAVSLAISLSIDATLLASLGVVPPTAPPPAAASPSPVAPEVPQPPKSAPPSHGVDVSGFLDALVIFGVLPKTALGARVGAGLAPLSWLETRLSGFVTATVSEAMAGGTADITLAAVQLDVCGAWSSLAAHPRVCFGGAYGQTTVQGQGFQRTAPELTARWEALAFRVDARLLASSLWRIDLGADLYWARPTRLGVISPDNHVVEEKDLGTVGVAVGFGPSFTF